MCDSSSKIDTEIEKDDPFIIPFTLGAELAVKSITRPLMKAMTTVYGAVPSRMIVIEEPRFPLEDDSFSILTEQFDCAYRHHIHLIKFKSRFVRHLFDNVIGFEYPKDVELVQFRAHPRIPVTFETEVFTGTKEGVFTAVIEDVSAGGCRLLLPKLFRVSKGTRLHLSFTLPDGQYVDNLCCAVMNVKLLNAREAARIGVSFLEPAQAIKKVEIFCGLFTHFLL